MHVCMLIQLLITLRKELMIYIDQAIAFIKLTYLLNNFLYLKVQLWMYARFMGGMYALIIKIWICRFFPDKLRHRTPELWLAVQE